MGVTTRCALIIIAITTTSTTQGANNFNQTAGFAINVDFKSWSNFGPQGGCVTCPFTCTAPTEGPNGQLLNRSDPTTMLNVPEAYKRDTQNGCCFANPMTSITPPSCASAADPADAEDCGYTYGPSLTWRITSTNPPEKPVRAILFASIDCENFWAVGFEFIKLGLDTSPTNIKGTKIINGGCYGDPEGAPIVLAGCLTTELDFDKSKTYSWDSLAAKCMGLSGQCSRTNGLWGRNLKCCKDLSAITGSSWDLSFPLYRKELKSPSSLSGPVIFIIVFGGVAMLMGLVHYGRALKVKAKETALQRELESSDDYNEIITPLNSEAAPSFVKPLRMPADLEVSLHEGDMIYRKAEGEVLYEGEMM